MVISTHPSNPYRLLSNSGDDACLWCLDHFCDYAISCTKLWNNCKESQKLARTKPRLTVSARGVLYKLNIPAKTLSSKYFLIIFTNYFFI